MALVCHPSEDHCVLARERVFLCMYLSCPMSLVTWCLSLLVHRTHQASYSELFAF